MNTRHEGVGGGSGGETRERGQLRIRGGHGTYRGEIFGWELVCGVDYQQTRL